MCRCGRRRSASAVRRRGPARLEAVGAAHASKAHEAVVRQDRRHRGAVLSVSNDLGPGPGATARRVPPRCAAPAARTATKRRPPAAARPRLLSDLQPSRDGVGTRVDQRERAAELVAHPDRTVRRLSKRAGPVADGIVAHDAPRRIDPRNRSVEVVRTQTEPPPTARSTGPFPTGTVSMTVCRFGSTRSTAPRSSSATQRLPAAKASAVVDGPTAAARPVGIPVSSVEPRDGVAVPVCDPDRPSTERDRGRRPVERDRLDNGVRPWIDARDGAGERVRNPDALVVGGDGGSPATDRNRLARLARLGIDTRETVCSSALITQTLPAPTATSLGNFPRAPAATILPFSTKRLRSAAREPRACRLA